MSAQTDNIPAAFRLPPRHWHAGGFGSLWTLFTLTLRQFLHGRRALVVLALSLLPAGLALLERSVDEDGQSKQRIEFVVLFNLIPHALLPLTALLYGSGLILDEQEEQTLTYLLIRPLPKWRLYLAKFLAALCMGGLLLSVFVMVTLVATYAGSAEWWDVFPKRMAVTMCVMSLSMTTYIAVFSAMSLLVKRSLIVGIVFIVVIEGLLSNVGFALRQLSIMYYFRVLALNWLDLDANMRRSWDIKLSEAPEPFACILTLMLTTVVAIVVAIYIFSHREFYVKTPESN